MIFDAEKGDTGLVCDANGDVIFSPITGDTHTGRVLAYSPGADELAREICIYRAPLTISPLGGFDQSTCKGPWAIPLYRELIRFNITPRTSGSSNPMTKDEALLKYNQYQQFYRFVAYLTHLVWTGVWTSDELLAAAELAGFLAEDKKMLTPRPGQRLESPVKE